MRFFKVLPLALLTAAGFAAVSATSNLTRQEFSSNLSGSDYLVQVLSDFEF